jgi:hypothetical protein
MSLSTDVTITLDGEEHTLRPSMKAASTISRQFEGFVGAFTALMQGQLDAYVAIIKAGITSKNVSTDDLKEAVWRTGLPKLAEPIGRYLTILQNGGRDPDAGSSSDEIDEGNDHI